MKPQTIIIANANQLAQGKRAMLTSLTTQDTYRLPDGWHSVAEWSYGQEVEEVNHFRRHSTRVGDLLKVEGDDGKQYGYVRVDRIVMVETADLIDEMIETLGHRSRADFLQHESGYADRKAWLVYISPVRLGWRRWLAKLRR